MDIKEKALAVLGMIVAVWLLCPLPEISIIIGLITGGSITKFLGLPSWTTWIGSIIGALIGYFVISKVGLLDDIKQKIEGVGGD